MKITDHPDFLSEKERDLALSVMDGRNEAVTYIYNIREICRSGQGLDFLQILDWLSRNRITGSRFIEWVRIEHKNALVKAVAHARRHMQRDSMVRKIIARGH